jgi:hypothetical protein
VKCLIKIQCTFMVVPTSEKYDNFLQNSVIQVEIFTLYVGTSKNDSYIFQHTKEYFNISPSWEKKRQAHRTMSIAHC